MLLRKNMFQRNKKIRRLVGMRGKRMNCKQDASAKSKTYCVAASEKNRIKQ